MTIRARWRGIGALIATLLLCTVNVEAQAPVDVAGWESTGVSTVELLEPPADFAREQRHDVLWEFPAAATDLARDLMSAYPEAWDRILDDLGQDVDASLRIRIARDPDEMRELAPVGHPPPEYAVGVAYPRFGVILLTLSAPESWEIPDLEKVLTHELSHIALFRAVDGHPLPRWFVEGVAIYQAGENDLSRIQTLWTATVAGNLVPLDELSGSFPRYPHRVSIAYAQSADVVAHLRNVEDESGRSFRELIENLRDGESFEDAIADAFGMSLATVEVRWREKADERFRTLPLLLSGSGIWVLASLLLVAAWWRRRRDKQARLAQWEAEEAAADAELTRVDRAMDDHLLDGRSYLRDGEDAIPIDADPPPRDPEVPTIEVDGRNHTLH